MVDAIRRNTVYEAKQPLSDPFSGKVLVPANALLVFFDNPQVGELQFDVFPGTLEKPGESWTRVSLPKDHVRLLEKRKDISVQTLFKKVPRE